MSLATLTSRSVSSERWGLPAKANLELADLLLELVHGTLQAFPLGGMRFSHRNTLVRCERGAISWVGQWHSGGWPQMRAAAVRDIGRQLLSR